MRVGRSEKAANSFRRASGSSVEVSVEDETREEKKIIASGVKKAEGPPVEGSVESESRKKR